MTNLTELIEWFSDRPLWLHEATRRLLTNGRITNDDLGDLLLVCKAEAGVDLANEKPSATKKLSKSELASPAASPQTLRLDRIRDVTGVNAISTEKPLEFGSQPLTIIYGDNGAGKSGYIRLLKQACGARRVGTLVPNVFESKTDPTGAILEYELNSQPSTASYSKSTGRIDALQQVEIFDSECARVYVTDQNEVAFEPRILALFSDLVSTSDALAEKLERNIARLPSKKPALPPALAGTPEAQWYSGVSHDTPKSAIAEKSTWTPSHDAELAKARKQLDVQDPAEEARRFEKLSKGLSILKTSFASYLEVVGEANSGELSRLTRERRAKREAANLAAKKAFDSAPLQGVGTEVWNELWAAARRYSQEAAYPESAYPNVSDSSRCVLCQQDLSTDAKIRLSSFEDFIKGDLAAAADDAESNVEQAVEKLKELPATQLLIQEAAAAGIIDDAEQDAVRRWATALRSRCDAMISDPETDPLPALPLIADLAFIDNRINALNKSAQSHKAQADPEGREAIRQQSRRLQARKWLHEQGPAVHAEVERSEKIRKLEKARSLVHTRILSVKKSELAETEITGAFVDRFNAELKALTAHRIPVELVKAKTQKGRVWHKIQISGAKTNVSAGDVLSDGEFRAVSLAAFFADASSHPGSAPLVFDDPISSLDQGYEEAIARRLVHKAQSQQVIVFTHRLSLVALLESAAKEQGIAQNVAAIGKEGRKRGVPRSAPLFAQRTKSALNQLCNERIPKARKRLNDEGWDAYEIDAIAICRDARATLERMVELDLLSEVIRRFSREVQTKDKIEKLAKIQISDCEFIDDMMTYFSTYIHSQPDETPTPPPEIDDLEQALIKLRDWRNEFEKRPLPTP